MSTIAQSHQQIPECVNSLLDRLDLAARNLSDERPEGPYMLEALLQDVRLCPSIGGGAAEPGEVADLTSKLAAARDAARVVLACPISNRDFALERLRSAIAAARNVVSHRVEAADASGDRSILFNARCQTCSFT